MKLLSVLFSVLFACIGSASAQQNPARKPKVRADVREKIQEKGIVQVTVILAGQWKPDAKLSRADALEQRKAITDTQRDLLKELTGTKHKLIHQHEVTPAIVLEVGPDALAVLENSSHVKDVFLVNLGKSSLLESVPLIGGDRAWTTGNDGTGYAVVIVDTGVDGNHPFLSKLLEGERVSKVIAARCYSLGSNCPNGQTYQDDLGAGVPCSYAVKG